MGRGGGELIISAFFVILWFAGGAEYAEKTGLKLEYNFCTSRENAKQLLSESDFDIFIGVPMTSGMCSSVGFINSSPVIESELAYEQKPNKDVSEDSLAAYLSDGNIHSDSHFAYALSPPPPAASSSYCRGSRRYYRRGHNLLYRPFAETESEDAGIA